MKTKAIKKVSSPKATKFAKTAKILRQVAAHILEEPKRLNMSDWGHTYAKAGGRIPPCRTVGCIAGWSIFLNQPEEWKAMLATDSDLCDSANGLLANPAVTARKILGITESQERRLFYADAWPDKYWDAFTLAKSKKVEAQIASDRIKHFIATKGKE